MEIEAALTAWIERLDARDPAEMHFGLERVNEVLRRMGLAPPPFRVLTVGGTNGKGSVVAYLSALLARAGLGPVGAYTSPHLCDYRERIATDGRLVDAATLVAAFEAVEAACGELRLSYFEFGTLAALEAFRRAGVAYAVLEVGLGGRLDAVNALDSVVAAVVSVGLDHQRWLGTDRDSIAREKAAIFRRARPAVVGDRDPPPALLDAVRMIGAEPRLIGADFDWTPEGDGWRFRGRSIVRGPLPDPPIEGRFQRDNAAVALAMFEAFDAARVPETAELAAALAGVRLPGRLERRRGKVEWLLDVAHNPQAAASLADWLASARPRRTLAVFAMLADKDAGTVARVLAPRIEHWFLAGLDGRRGQSAKELAGKTADFIRNPLLCENIAAAVEAATQVARTGDRIVVFGSFHGVEEALKSGLIPEDDPCASV